MNRREVIGGAGASLLMASPPLVPASRARAAFQWPTGSSGAVSVSYDDGLDCHLDLAMPALEQRGMAGTFYITMKNIAYRLADWEGVSARSHELGNHTMSHPCDLRRFTAAQFADREIVPMEAWLDDHAGRARSRTFAYPCDVTNLGSGPPTLQANRYAHLLARAGIVSARTSEGEPNRPETTLRRPHRLQALAVGYDAGDAAAVLDYLKRAVRHGHWAILIFHELIPVVGEEGQVSTAMHEQVLDAIATLPLWCAPVGRVFGHIARHAAPGSITSDLS